MQFETLKGKDLKISILKLYSFVGHTFQAFGSLIAVLCIYHLKINSMLS
jgi:hypothetical protein